MDTGLFVFQAGDTLTLRVEANSYKKLLTSARIIDAQLITQPRTFCARMNPELAGKFPYPSPYFDPALPLDEQGAVTSFGTGDASGDASKMSWTSPLVQTYRNKGRYKTSFYLTVELSSSTKDTKDYRVFYFDPECDVGSGAVPP